MDHFSIFRLICKAVFSPNIIKAVDILDLKRMICYFQLINFNILLSNFYLDPLQWVGMLRHPSV